MSTFFGAIDTWNREKSSVIEEQGWPRGLNASIQARVPMSLRPVVNLWPLYFGLYARALNVDADTERRTPHDGRPDERPDE